MKYLLIIIATVFIATVFIAVLAIPQQEYEVVAEFSDTEEVEEVVTEDQGVESSSTSSSLSVSEYKPVYEDTGKVSGIDVEVLKAHICEVFGDSCEEALEIATCESVHFTDFIGDEGLVYVENGIEYGRSYGPFQIRYLRGRPTPEELLDPVFNVQFAKQMFDTQGWGPWTCKYRLASL